MVRTDKIENKHVPEATGASISKVALLREKKSISVKQLEGYYDGMPPKSCTEMINTAINIANRIFNNIFSSLTGHKSPLCYD